MRNTVATLERVFADICNKAFPYEWDEDHISYTLMQELRSLFRNRVINFQNWSKIVDWRSFKNRGQQETRYGDIALIVNVQFSSGEMLKGVACLEAKRDFRSRNFESMDIAQLNRLHHNLPQAQLLLYTHEQQRLQMKFPDHSTWRSHFWVSPINTARELITQLLPADNKYVLRTAFPFAMFLTARVFWGLDLDFRKEIAVDIEAGINRIIDPTYLGVVNVYYEHQKPVETKLADIWEEI